MVLFLHIYYICQANFYEETSILGSDKRQQNAADRHAREIKLLNAQGYCTVSEMSRILNVSPMTIRRDLHILAEKQLIQTRYGGAQILAPGLVEPSFDVRTHEHLEQKQAIGEKAVELFVEQGDVIGIDSGSTMVGLASALPDIPLTIVTHSLAVANIAARNEQCQLLLLGGVLQHRSGSFYDPHAIASLQKLNINKLFLAAAGMLIPDGLSTGDLPDAEVKRALIKSSRQIILCMDSSKIGQSFLAYYASLDVINTLITDDKITLADRKALEHLGMHIIPTSPATAQTTGLSAHRYKAGQQKSCLGTAL